MALGGCGSGAALGVERWAFSARRSGPINVPECGPDADQRDHKSTVLKPRPCCIIHLFMAVVDSRCDADQRSLHV